VFLVFVPCILDVVEINNTTHRFAPLLYSLCTTDRTTTLPTHRPFNQQYNGKPLNRSVFSCNSDGSTSSLMMADYCQNMYESVNRIFVFLVFTRVLLFFPSISPTLPPHTPFLHRSLTPYSLCFLQHP
jgi:hypothetical protein